MQNGLRRCLRCAGRKKMYKVGNATCYSHTNTGGVLVDCPLCLGKGTIGHANTIVSVVETPVKKVEVYNAAKAIVKEIIETQAEQKLLPTETELKKEVKHVQDKKAASNNRRKTKEETKEKTAKVK